MSTEVPDQHNANYAKNEWFDEMFELALRKALDLDFGSGSGGWSSFFSFRPMLQPKGYWLDPIAQ